MTAASHGVTSSAEPAAAELTKAPNRRGRGRRSPARLALAIALCSAGALAPAHAAWADGALDALSDAVKKGDVQLNLRYRAESVDDDAYSRKALASTLRSRVTLRTDQAQPLRVLFEVDDVRNAFSHRFDVGSGATPHRTRYPVVVDPSGTEVNQAFVEWQPDTSVVLRLGRQRINLDNQRMIGSVGWRQNEQTFDAASLKYTQGPLTVQYAYLDEVRRILGDEVPTGHQDLRGSHLLNLAYTLGDVTAVAYGYEIDNGDVAANATTTYGLRASGKTAFGDPAAAQAVRYSADWARQRDTGDNPVDYDATYYGAELAYVRGAFDLAAGLESLGGDESRAGHAFRTPLATLHAFNGWADQFLATPQDGLDDRYLKLAWRGSQWSAEARAHRFEGEDSGQRLGREFDALVGYQYERRLRFDLKFANFDGEGPRYHDVTKAWLMVTAQFP